MIITIMNYRTNNITKNHVHVFQSYNAKSKYAYMQYNHLSK